VSGNPTYRVIKTYQEWLATQVPMQPQEDVVLPVFYSHPGDRWAGSALVWFDDIDDEYETHSLRAVVRRRLIQSQFSIIIGVELLGDTEDSMTALQFECDQYADTIRSIIDLDIATEEHLHSPELIDSASLIATATERGMTATGCGTRTTLRVSFDARFL